MPATPTPRPPGYPDDVTAELQIVEQEFEHGRMIWLEDVGVLARVIFVLYDDGQFAMFSDTWTEGEPESDPAFVPPAGLLQPVRLPSLIPRV